MATSSQGEGKLHLISSTKRELIPNFDHSQTSAVAPTESELLDLASEQDGTMGADEKSEQKRLKEEDWAQYAETNPRGAGNTMNRG